MQNIKILVLFLFMSAHSFAQTFEWQTSFFGIFDNREYFNPIQYPQTIFGARGAFEAGFRFDNIQRLRFGVNYLHEYGAPQTEDKNALTMYYEYNKKPFKMKAGLFPRIGETDFPLAMLTDTFLYYRPNIEGMLMEINTEKFKQNLWVDWTGRQSETTREAFFVGSSGKFQSGMFYMSNYLLMHHNAGTMTQKQLQDNLGMSLGLGFDLTKTVVLDSLNVSVNYLFSAHRDRADNIWHPGKGVYFKLNTEYKKASVIVTSYFGESQRFAFGDAFYHAENYSRIDLNYFLIRNKNVSAEFSWSFHIADGDVDHQQRLLVFVNIGGGKSVGL